MPPAAADACDDDERSALSLSNGTKTTESVAHEQLNSDPEANQDAANTDDDHDKDGLASQHGRVLYDVVLPKGACGFGIYFTAAADGVAMVDPVQPFYRLPDNTEAPGEASGVIAPGDRLLAINSTRLENWQFQDVVEELRRTPPGDVVLSFERMEKEDEENQSNESEEQELQKQKRVRWRLFDWQASGSPSLTDTPPTSTTNSTFSPPSLYEQEMLRAAAMEELLLEMENKIRSLEQDVEREKKCRFLSERKNVLYRNALQSLSDENAQLKYQLTVANHTHETTQRFQFEKLQLSI